MSQELWEAFKPTRVASKGIKGIIEPWESSYSLIMFISHVAFLYFFPLVPLK
jgi:hypothetical protein